MIKAENTTIIHDVIKADLCVVGGGLAGMCAAVSAARHGSKVVLMQERPVLGGNASSEIRMWVCGAVGSHNRATGIIEEMELENYYRNPMKDYFIWSTVLLETVENEPNIELLLNCSCMSADTADGLIRSVTGWQMTTQRFVKVEARLFADCSGDSILAPLCGADFRMGREAASEFGERVSIRQEDKMTMGMSCLMQIRRDHQKQPFVAPAWVERVPEEMIVRRIPNIYNPYENFWTLELGGDRDSIGDTEKLRDELLKLALGIWDYIKNSGKVKDADTLALDFLGFLPGKRESRRMMGPVIVTQNDILAGGRFPDVVAFGGWPLDDHDPKGFYKEGPPNTNDPTPSPYGLPYRSLYSRNIRNLFFAGRNISVTHAALSSTRVMATCSLLGQAVGTAASIACKAGKLPADLYPDDIDLLQQTLMDDGCFLPGMRRRISEKTKTAKLKSEIGEAAETLRNGADRDHPSFGEEEQGCRLPLGSDVTYIPEKPTFVSSVRLSFDSDLDRETLPGDRCEQMHGMRANVWSDSPHSHVPKTLVREFVLSGVDESGREHELRRVSDNRRATVSVEVNEVLSSLSLKILKTWDDRAESAHVYSFDFK